MNILIVDDEKIIVDGLHSLTAQSGYNFHNIFVAYGGKEAIEIMQREEIDILFSDIKMPVMDGFELIEKVRELPLVPEIILITGFAEFEYVQRALNAGIAGYLLKPIDETQFEAILQKAVGNVLHKRFVARTRAENADLEDKVLNMNIERIVNLVFSGGLIGREEKNTLEEIFNKENDRYYLLATFHINIKNNELLDISFVLEELKKELILHFKKEGRKEKIFLMRTANGKNLHCLCVGTIEMDTLRAVFRWFYDSFQFLIPIEMYISMSDVRKKLSRELYTHSQEAYYERFLNEGVRILQYSGADNIHRVSMIENELKILEVHISNGELTEFQKVLRQIFSVQYIKESYLTVRAVYFLVCNAVIMTFHKMQMDIPGAMVDEFLSEAPLNNIERVEDLAEYIYGIVFDMMLEHKNFNAGTDLIIKKIVNYVNLNFHEDLSIKEMSAAFGLTPNYLSQIFKTETGESFVIYLNRLRIEKACVLLKTSTIKISEIVRQVGYNDSQYFYRVFKKYVGQTPIEYRMSNS